MEEAHHKRNFRPSTWGESDDGLFKDLLFFCMDRGALTATELAVIFERPISTVKFWIRGALPGRIYRSEVFKRLLALEKHIKSLGGKPVVPYDTRRQDRTKYIQELAHVLKSSNPVSTEDTA